MRTYYEGFGTLLDNAGQKIEAIGYSFFFDSESGIRGMIRSVDQFLPTVTTFHLLLQDRTHFVAIWLGCATLDRMRLKYRYLLYPAPDQPHDPNNLMPHTPRPPPGNEAF